jgi:hypothetical protein
MAFHDIDIEIYKVWYKHDKSLGSLDLYDGTSFPLSINFGIKNVNNISGNTGSYSKTIKIPATSNNNQLLRQVGFDGLEDVIPFIDNNIKVRVKASGSIIIQGSLQVKAIISTDVIDSYSVTILGDNNNWARKFNQEYMCDINSYDDMIEYTWNNNLWKHINDTTTNSDDGNFCIPVICWGAYSHDYVPFGGKKIHLVDQTPALFIKPLLEHYFKEAGYQIQSLFFETIDFKKLIIPTDWSNFVALPASLAIQEAKAEFVGAAKCKNSFNSLGDPINPETYSFTDSNGNLVPFHYFWNEGIFRFAMDSEFVSADPPGCPYSGLPWNAAHEGSYSQKIPFDVEITDVSNALTPSCMGFYNFDYYYGTFGTPNWGYNCQHNIGDMIQWVDYDWVCPLTTMYDITVELSFITCPEADVVATLIHNQGGVENIIDDGTAVMSPNNSANTLYHAYREVNLNATAMTLNAGDRIYVKWELANGSWFGAGAWDTCLVSSLAEKMSFLSPQCEDIIGWPTTGNWGVRPTTITIERSGVATIDDEFRLIDQLPCDIKKIELIQAMTEMFNLHWWTDDTSKTVYVEPYDSFYDDDKKSILDWSDKVAFNLPAKTTLMTDILSNENLFKYGGSVDGYVSELEQELENPFLSLLVTLGDSFLPDKKEYPVQLFAPTKMILDYQLSDNFVGAPWIPLIVDEWVDAIGEVDKPERSLGHTLRCLSYEGMKEWNGQAWCSYSSNSPSWIESSYPLAQSYHYSIDAGIGWTQNLDWADNDVTAAAATFNSKGLYTKFWQKMIERLSLAPRMKKVKIHLTPKDISQLDLRKVIRITDNTAGNDSYWIVHKVIDYKPHIDEPTFVELIQFQVDDAPHQGPVDMQRPTTSGDELSLATDSIKKSTTNSGQTKGLKSSGVQRKYSSGRGKKKARGQGLALRGNNKYADNNGSIVLGTNLTTHKQNQIVLGQYNKVDNDAILIIGGGTSATDKRNILTVGSDGTISFGDTGGGSSMVTHDSSGNVIDLFTEDDTGKVVTKVIKG